MTSDPRSMLPHLPYPPPPMTLRDYFAGQALMAFGPSLPSFHVAPETIATDCYKLADAMLEERKK